MNERYSINIADIQLCILSDEPEEFVHATVAQLDALVRDLTVKNKRCSKMDAALLCALDSLGEKNKCEKKIKNLEAQISLYEATIRRLKEELDEARAGAAPAAEAEAMPSAEVIAEPEAAAEEKAEAAAVIVPKQEKAKVKDEEQMPLIPAPEEKSVPEETPAEEPRSAAIHGAKLRQIEELLRRRSEENAAGDSAESVSPERSDKLREIEELLRGSGNAKSLTEALHDALGK